MNQLIFPKKILPNRAEHLSFALFRDNLTSKNVARLSSRLSLTPV